MIKTYRQMMSLFDRKQRRGFYILMVIMIFAAIAEIMGISSVMLFLSILSDPGLISENAVLSGIYSFFGFEDTYYFQIFLSVFVFFVVLVSLAIKALDAYAITRFANAHGYALACQLLQSYLTRPYSWFLNKNSADMAKDVLDEIDYLVFHAIIPMLRLIAGSVSTIAIVTFLVVVDPLVSILSASLLGGGYAAIYLFLRKYIYRVGQEILKTNQERYRIVTEVMGGLKQVKLSGLEEAYTARYEDPAKRRAIFSTTRTVLGELPRYALEAMTFGILLSIIFILLLRNEGNLVAIVPTLGIFAFAVMRLLPTIQKMYHSLVAIRSSTALLNRMDRQYHEAREMGAFELPSTQEPIKLTQELSLANVDYRYGASERAALHDVSLTIKANTTVGIVGGTGAGKTTLIDLILGLLDMQDGTLAVDGEPITKMNKRSWQKAIGYVPQDIFLTDSTIAQNIAFGIEKEDIDMAAVESAARTAALHDFVTQELPEGYQTTIGERGVRLSGGQRQRIGIARALYGNPSLLIMDEATSALDNITERVVMEAVHNIRSQKTIILIAHRLTTVQDCDQIFMMERGTVAAVGTYDELVANNETFREMALKA